MGLLINGIGRKCVIPNVLSRKYKYAAFDGPVMKYQATLVNGKVEVKTVNIKKKIEDAWMFVTKRAAFHKPCNDYFKTLSRGKTLREVLAEGDITLHLLEPKSGFNLEDLPDANCAGRDIGINFWVFIGEPRGLVGVLIHEIAHIAGASTNPDPYNRASSMAAEKALLYCLCRKQFRPDALGLIQNIKLQETDVRFA